MNPMMLMTMTMPANQGKASVSNNSAAVEGTPFFDLLNNVLSAGIPSSEEESEVEREGLLNLLNHLNETGMTLTADGLDDVLSKKLLSLLPDEWKKEFESIASGNEVDRTDWTELQHLLLAYLTVNEQVNKGSTAAEPVLDQLKQAATNLFPHLQAAGNGQAFFEQMVKHIKGQIQINPKAQSSSQAFAALISANEKPLLSLPQPIFSSVFAEEAATQGSARVDQGLQLNQSSQELGQAMSRAEQATIHIGDKLPKEVQQQQFLRQFQMILNRGVFTQQGQVNSLSIKLFPQHLGRVDIQLTQVEGTIVAKILASSTASREMIESQLSQLRNTFIQQQIPVERIEVADQYVGKEKENQSSSQREGDNSGDPDREQEEEQAFNDLLNELTFDEEV